MSVPLDETDFIDREMQAARKAAPAAAPVSGGLPPVAGRPPTREEIESRVVETQNRLNELTQARTELERQRVALEEDRRRRQEFETGKAEMIQNLTRGIGLLEKSEFDARRDAEQMGKTLVDFRGALEKVQHLNEEQWTVENVQTELSRALTAIENARMEWNSARLKFPVLDGDAPRTTGPGGAQDKPSDTLSGIAEMGLIPLARLGLALTWPVAVALLVVGILLLIFIPRH